MRFTSAKPVEVVANRTGGSFENRSEAVDTMFGGEPLVYHRTCTTNTGRFMRFYKKKARSHDRAFKLVEDIGKAISAAL
jgi:hypothetical protein